MRRGRGRHRCRYRPLGAVAARRSVAIPGARVSRCYCGKLRVTGGDHRQYEREPLPARAWGLRPVVAHTGLLGCVLTVLAILMLDPRRVRLLPHADPKRWPGTKGNLPPVRGGASITASATGGNADATAAWTGGVPPGSGDAVLLASTSGNITINVTTTWASLDCTGYTHTLTLTAAVTLTVNGNFKLASGMTYTTGASASLTIGGTSSFTSAGKSHALSIFFAPGAGNTVTLQDALTNTQGLNHQSGTLTTGGFAVTATVFNASVAGTRALNLGASSVTLSGGAAAWNVSNGTAYTLSAGTSTITLSGAGSTFVSANTALTYNNVVFTGSGNAGLAGAVAGTTFNNLTRTGTATKTDTVTFGTGAAITVTGTLTLTGNSITNRLLAQSLTVGTQSTLTAAVVSLTNVDFMDIKGAGAAVWTGASLGDGGGNTGITFTVAAGTSNGLGGVNRYAIGASSNGSNTAMWATSSGGASGASVPLPQDSMIFDANSPAGSSYTMDMPRLGAGIDATGFAGTLSLSNVAHTIYGSITTNATMTFANTQPLTLAGRRACTITSAGHGWAQTITLNCPGGTYTLQDDFATTASGGSGNLNTNLGTFASNGKNVNIFATSQSVFGAFIDFGGGGTWTLRGTGIVWQSVATFLNIGTTLLDCTDTSATGKTFQGQGKTVPAVRFAASAGAYLIQSSNTFTGLTIQPGATVQITAGTTQTLASGAAFSATGTAANPITLQSNTAGTRATLSCSSGTVSCDYLVLQDSNATGGATFYAGGHSTNTSNNTGWSFIDAPFFQAGVDTWTVGDGASGTRMLPRAVADTVAVGDQAQRTFAGTLTSTDTFAASDAASRLVTFGCSVADAVTVLDAAVERAALLRAVADAVTVLDTATERVASLRAVADAVVVADAAAERAASLRAAADAVAILDAAVGRVAVESFTADAVIVADAAGRIAHMLAVGIDTIVTLDTAERGVATGRDVADVVVMVDAADRIASALVVGIDVIMVVDAAARSVAPHSATAVDLITVADAAIQILARVTLAPRFSGGELVVAGVTGQRTATFTTADRGVS